MLTLSLFALEHRLSKDREEFIDGSSSTFHGPCRSFPTSSKRAFDPSCLPLIQFTIETCTTASPDHG